MATSSAPKTATLKTATPKTATPKTATPKTATPKTATPKTATPKSDRMSAADFEAVIAAIRGTSQGVEGFIQKAFLASWRDLACSHSTERFTNLWDVLVETKSPFKSQVSLAMRALAGMARPCKTSQKWERTGRAPLSYEESGWYLHLEDIDKAVLRERAAWAIHFRAIQVKPTKSAFTWHEVLLFMNRVGVASKQGRIPEKDLAKYKELLSEIERISAR